MQVDLRPPGTVPCDHRGDGNEDLFGSQRTVALTTGREVDFEEGSGLEHLFRPIIAEGTFSEQGFAVVHERCIREVHYVAGHPHQAGSGMSLAFLIEEFGVLWDRRWLSIESGVSYG